MLFDSIRMHILKKDLEKTLSHYGKTLEHIKYVAYNIVDQSDFTLKSYYCTIDELLDATMHATSPYELLYMCWVWYVGDGWWMEYDYQGVLQIHSLPAQPCEHRAPLQNEIMSVEKK